MTPVKTGKNIATGKPTAAEVTDEMVAAWKEKYGKVFYYEATDGKKAWFRRPDRKIAGLSSTAPDAVAGNDILARNCFLGGDECIINEDEYFFGLSSHLPKFLSATLGECKEL